MTLALKCVALFLAVNIIVLVTLGLHVVRLRRYTRTILLDGGKPDMVRAIRAHGNASEYIPAGMLLLYLMQQMGADIYWIVLIGTPFTLGRLIHPYAIFRQRMRLRATAMSLTFLPLLVGAVWLLWCIFRTAS